MPQPATTTSLLAAGALAAAAAAPASQHDVFPQDHTNIIVVLMDDVNANDFGCYGNTVHRTPNVDALAESGTLFETFFVTPVSSPTRVAIMTGRRATKTGWYNMRQRTPGGIGRAADIATDEVTFGHLFSRAGYATAFAGKWQLTGENPATKVQDMGFQESLIWASWGDIPGRRDGGNYLGGLHNGGISRYWHPGLLHNGIHIPTEPDDYGPDMFVDFVCDFIERRAGQPFFVYYPMVLPHRPWVETPDALGVRENSWEAFQANVEYIDKKMGKILDTLERNDLRERTLVVFLGDNGTQTRGKGTPTEWGARSPAIFSMPGTVQAGARSMALGEVVDVFPTIAEYAGIPVPEGLDICGISLRPVLEGETDTHHEFIYSPLGHYRVIRDDMWLLEANTPERYGRFYYTGGRRDGFGYADVTNIDHPFVNEAKARFERYMAQVPFPEYDPDARFDFEDLTDHRINQQWALIHREEREAGVETVRVPGVDPSLIPQGVVTIPPSGPRPEGWQSRGLRAGYDDED